MRPGIFAKTFADGSLEASLDAVAASGMRAIQFNLALTGGPSLPDDVPPGLAAWVRDVVAARGLEIVAVSGTCNLAHPSHDVRRHCLAALEALVAAAPTLGTRVVTLCTGTRDPEDMWRWHPDNATREAWADMLGSVGYVVQLAERHDVVVAFEPEPANVVADAGAGRRLLDEIASPHLKVVVDAANLVGPGELERQAEVLERAFESLGADLVLAHAKDVRADGAIVPAGQGELDYARYVALLRQAGYDGALVLHGLAPADVPASVAFLERHLAGVAEVA
jgi:sugar phosphate isomerase/epimerase